MKFNRSFELKNISFKYPNSDIPAIDNLTLKINKFSKVGITGQSGCGKTTLINILLGLIEPDKGEIFIDGKELKKSNKISWLKKVGYVPQEIYISDETVISNIAFGIDKKLIDINRVYEVARIANIDNFIRNELEHGYNTNVGDNGIKLSGGQKQRIGIARALYRKPQVIILDEGTSSLDNETENEVMKAIYKMSKEITIILIAHRLNTLDNCDYIYKIEKGKIIQNYKNI